MNKTILRNIHLVNWYGFSNRTIPVSENLTLISGENECGKSTILDAVKYAYTGDTQFNKATSGYNTGVGKRNLVSYTRCLVDASSGIYARPADKIPVVYTHIALEYFDQINESSFVLVITCEDLERRIEEQDQEINDIDKVYSETRRALLDLDVSKAIEASKQLINTYEKQLTRLNDEKVKLEIFQQKMQEMIVRLSEMGVTIQNDNVLGRLTSKSLEVAEKQRFIDSLKEEIQGCRDNLIGENTLLKKELERVQSECVEQNSIIESCNKNRMDYSNVQEQVELIKEINREFKKHGISEEAHMSGIFRDVYLLKRPEKTIRDYYITTDVEKDSVVVKLDMHFAEPVETKVTIEDKYGAVVARGETAENGVLELTVLNPVLWNAENPYLYQVILTMPDEVIVDQIGFRTIEIKDKVVYFNGEKIKFRGVNRHDSDPETGFVINVQQIKKDLMLMKQHNFNAIRSSHYPNAPYFYQMCDKYGFMVIDEADIEAHGPFMLYRKEDTDQNRFYHWNEKIADDPAWEKAIVDRVQLMVQRDKNRPSIVMWSMGNESAYGCNFEKALAWTKKFDPDRITQYESARYRNYDITYNYDNLDLYSRMYPPLQEIEDYLKNDGSKPFLLVEYCHSMGNGPGDFEDYFQMIHKDDRMCGGFVWEWCDHAIAHGTAENGKTRYYYGGDHGETIHDGNFCVDGLVYPDRTPHTGLLEYKNVYRPVRIVSYDQENGQMVLHNYMDFDDLKDYVDIFYEMTQDGLTVEKGKLANVVASPHSDAKVELKLQVPNTGKIYLKLIYRLKKEMPLLEHGYELGFDEMKLANEDDRNRQAVKWLEQEKITGTIAVKENDKQIVLQAKDFTYVLDKRTGLFENMQFAGRSYINHVKSFR